MSGRLFTSESVSEGHPDKVCDRISDEVVDAFAAADGTGDAGVEPTRHEHIADLLGAAQRPGDR